MFTCNVRLDITDLKAPDRHLCTRLVNAHLLKRELTENVHLIDMHRLLPERWVHVLNAAAPKLKPARIHTGATWCVM